ncbi:MAG: M13 family metallopeptidase [Erysipelotrichaceae bacterium]|nr:M13 family metallopeptidase [Erysipelotrichaceae bacterium]
MENKVRIQDDLYEAVNGEWLKTIEIPEDRPSTGAFSIIDQEVEKTMMDDFKALAAGEKTTDIREVNEAIKLYRKVLDTDRRNREGIAPVMPLLHQIAAIDSAEALNDKAEYLFRNEATLPFLCGVETDMMDTSKNSLIMAGPRQILPDTTYYGTEPGNQLLEVYKAMAAQALSFTDLSEEDRKQYLEDTVAFDALLAQKVKSQVEWADYVSCYNPMSTDEVAGCLQPLDFKALLHRICGEEIPQTVIVYDPKAIKEASFYFNEENLPLYVHWSYVQTLLAKTKLLSEELYAIGTTYRRALMGIEKDPELEKQAYRIASDTFSEPVGLYYGRTYFGEEAKKDVVDMVKKIIEAYKDRMRKNTFLQPETKEKAIAKLSAINIKMGYPDKVRDLYARMTVDEKDSYYDAMSKLDQVMLEEEIDKLHKPVDRNTWLMPGHMVNACYDPNRNDITFPAAILQKPFYSINQSVSENLGGIGAVFAHEISHAFDNNGAHFDENGNLFNWWKEEDEQAFKALTAEMVKQWDGLPFCGDKVNGELVVSECIADNGGMAVTLQIMHDTEGADYQAYFTNWARVWSNKAKPEYMLLLLKNDVHAPAKLRANIPVRNFPEWYEAFGATEKDEMYIAPEKRIVIW